MKNNCLHIHFDEFLKFAAPLKTLHQWNIALQTLCSTYVCTLIVTGLLDFHWTSGGWSSTGCCSLRPLESVFCKFRRCWWAGLLAESLGLMRPWLAMLDDSDCRRRSWLMVKPCQVSKERMRTIARANPAMAATNLSFSFMSSFLLIRCVGPSSRRRGWHRRRQRHFPADAAEARHYRNLAFSQILMQ